MDFVHACAFCGWSRNAATAIVAPPGCPACGCRTDSVAAADHAGGEDAPRERLHRHGVWLKRGLLTAFSVALVGTAARVGYDVAAVPGTITAIGAAGYLLLPFVPERVGSFPG